jgi:DNA-3-methyladenine glycosylase
VSSASVHDWERAAPLHRSFYERPPLVVARDVLGRVLVHSVGRSRRAGRIVEVEAYRGAGDPASHAFRGPTARNEVMFGPAGHAYVYFTYGMHHCLNLVTGPAGRAEAVLVRAIEPLDGLEAMGRCRGGVPRERLGRGPGCVAEALGLDLRQNGIDLTRGPLWIADLPASLGGYRVARSPRIGIRLARERPWRLFLTGHPCVSGPRTPRAKPSRIRSPRASGSS